MDTAFSLNSANTQQKNDALLRMLDKGIDDMEAGREMPVEKAFEKITELRDRRRNAGT